MKKSIYLFLLTTLIFSCTSKENKTISTSFIEAINNNDDDKLSSIILDNVLVINNGEKVADNKRKYIASQHANKRNYSNSKIKVRDIITTERHIILDWSMEITFTGNGKSTPSGLTILELKGNKISKITTFHSPITHPNDLGIFNNSDLNINRSKAGSCVTFCAGNTMFCICCDENGGCWTEACGSCESNLEGFIGITNLRDEIIRMRPSLLIRPEVKLPF